MILFLQSHICDFSSSGVTATGVGYDVKHKRELTSSWRRILGQITLLESLPGTQYPNLYIILVLSTYSLPCINDFFYLY